MSELEHGLDRDRDQDQEQTSSDIIEAGSGFWVDTTGGNRYFIDDERYKLTKNGVVYDMQTHKFVGTTSKALRFQVGLNATEAINKRWQDYREAASEGLSRAAPNSQGGSPGAWALIVQKQAELAQDKDQGFASTKAAEFVGKSIGALDERGKLPRSDDDELSGLLSGLKIDQLRVFIGILAENE